MLDTNVTIIPWHVYFHSEKSSIEYGEVSFDRVGVIYCDFLRMFPIGPQFREMKLVTFRFDL